MDNEQPIRQGSPDEALRGAPRGAPPEEWLLPAPDDPRPTLRVNSRDSALGQSTSSDVTASTAQQQYIRISRSEGILSEPAQSLPSGGARCPTHCPADCGNLPPLPTYEQVVSQPPEPPQNPGPEAETVPRRSRTPVAYLARQIATIARVTTDNAQRVLNLETAHVEIEEAVSYQNINVNRRLHNLANQVSAAVRQSQADTGRIDPLSARSPKQKP